MSYASQYPRALPGFPELPFNGPPPKLQHPQAPPGFPQLPFNGPPPEPQHFRVNPQDWQNGSWVANPAFNSSKWSLVSSQSQPTWIPSQAWHHQRQQEWEVQQQQMAAAAAFKTKRAPPPLSAEYLATKLVDNPLGLSHMVPREELYGPSHDGIPAATPWIWNPRGLEPDDNQAGPSTTDARAPESPPQPSTLPRLSIPSSPPPQTAPPPTTPPHSAASHSATSHSGSPANCTLTKCTHAQYALDVGSSSQPREMTNPTPQTSTMPTRYSSEQPEHRRSTDTVPVLDRPQDRPLAYQRDSAPEIFTAPHDMQPTFLTNIVRTPQHYKTPSSSAAPQPRSIYGPPSSLNSTDPQQLASCQSVAVATSTAGTNSPRLPSQLPFQQPHEQMAEQTVDEQVMPGGWAVDNSLSATAPPSEGMAPWQIEAYIDSLLTSWEHRRHLLSMIRLPDADSRGLFAAQVHQRLGEVEAQISTLLIHIIASRQARRAAQRLAGIGSGDTAGFKFPLESSKINAEVSEAVEQLPSSLFITGVNDCDEHPIFAGGFGDVYQASYQGKMVALKRIRIFTADSTTHRNRLLLEIAQGLEYLHSMDVVHGDLRGNNILITDEGSACLSDFGLATSIADADSTITSSSNRAGSSQWFAPAGGHLRMGAGLSRSASHP
ncbi:hypothetical protein MSAN_02316800 [Mycena sanguinolenta]|uniref:Protein kinase domain-containing protein n=1 Tax=Mycena sanguinolenta TaxID=230812 RepID=A0A8H6X8N9_9AGAR|nr:hypothetical protein MSAN_02316800 [Mycena sanguinolenta]